MKRAPLNSNALLGILWLTTALELIGLGMAIPIFAPLIVQSDHAITAGIPDALRSVVYGLLIASYPLSQFFGTPVFGAFSDRYGRRPLLLLARTGTLLSYLISGCALLIGNLPLLFAARLLDGFTGGNIAITQAIIADQSSGRNASRSFGLIGMAFGVGFIIGPAFGGLLSDPSLVSWFSYATPFWGASIFTAISIWLVWQYLPETNLKPNNHPVSLLSGITQIRAGLRNANLRWIFLTIFVYTLGFNFFTQFFPVYLVQIFSYSQKDIGLLFGYIGIWIAFAQGGTNRYVTKYLSSYHAFVLGLAGLTLTMPLILLPTVPWVLYTIMPFIANASGIAMPNSTATLSDRAVSGQQGRVLGINEAFRALGMGIPPLIAGFLTVLDGRLPLITSSILLGAGWLMSITLIKPSNGTSEL